VRWEPINSYTFLYLFTFLLPDAFPGLTISQKCVWGQGSSSYTASGAYSVSQTPQLNLRDPLRNREEREGNRVRNEMEGKMLHDIALYKSSILFYSIPFHSIPFLPIAAEPTSELC